MKKAISLSLAALLALTAAGCGSEEDHVHDYSVKKMEEAFVAAEADCFNGRLYFYVCSICGASSGENKDPKQQFVWQGSDALGHEFAPEGCQRAGCDWVSVESGTLQNGLQWAYYPDGVLRFFGSGALPDWSDAQMQAGEIPWLKYGVRSVDLPKSITAIGDRSFSGLSRLTDITLPWGVTSIGESAFEGCTKLAELDFPDSINTIGKNAFRACKSLTAVTLPRYTVSLDGNSFASCSSLASISIDPANTVFSVKNGCLVENATGKLIASTNTGTIPEDGSVTSIGEAAFEGRTDLVSIRIPASVTSIGERAFYGCSAVAEIYVDPTNQYYQAKGNCLIERSNKKLIQGCSSSVIPIDGSVLEIGDHAFADCTGLTSLHLPGTVEVVSSSAFTGCSGLETITAAESNSRYSAMGNCLIVAGTRTLMLGCKNSVIPDDGSVIRIGNGAFWGSSITELVIPDAVTEIGDAAFQDCSELTELTVGKGITTKEGLNAKAFTGCGALTKVHVAEDHPNLIAKFGCIVDTSTGTLLLGTNNSIGRNAEKEVLQITSIGDYAFAGRNSLEAFFVPVTVTSIGENAFAGCSIFSTIAYEGSQEEWDKIQLGNGWTAFTIYEGAPNCNQ